MRHSLLAALVALALVTLTACSGCGAPKAKAIDGKVAQALQETSPSKPSQDQDQAQAVDASSNEAPAPQFDHSAFGSRVAEHAKFEKGRVDYSGLRADEATLDTYLQSLEGVELKALSRDAQLALLLNAYNAFTLKLILENYGEIDSIRDLSDPWGTKRWKLAGDELSLDDIEHGLIRPIFKDPRIHFAVNCASIGCPPLADFAFTGEEIDEQLDLVTSKALSNPRYAALEGGELRVTKIMEWYGEDFTKEGWDPTADSIAEWVAPRSTAEVQAYVEKGDPKVAFLDYDWSLNDVE